VLILYIYTMNKHLKFFGLSTSFFNLAYDIGKVFSVLYIYIFFGNSINIAIGGLVIISIFHLLTILFLGKTMGKIGVRTTLIFSTILFFLSFIPLYSIDDGNKFLNYGISLVLFGIARGMYFLPYHYYVLKFTKDKNRGGDYGKFLAICTFFTIFSPFIGGYTTNTFGIQGVALLSAIVFILSLIPLSRIENLKFNVTINLLKLVKLPNFKKSFSIDFLLNIQNQVSFWSIYVFIILDKNYLDFGILFTVINVIVFVAVPLLAKLFDHKNKKRIFRIDGIFTGIIWIIRYFSTTPLFVLISDSLYKINNSVKDTNFNLINYDLLKREDDDLNIDEKIILRECYLNIIIIISIPILLILVHFFGINVVFLIAALASFLFTLT